MPNKPIACEISLSKKVTLSPSELIQMFFISHNACKRYFCFLKAKQTAFTSLFNALVLKNMATDLDHD